MIPRTAVAVLLTLSAACAQTDDPQRAVGTLEREPIALSAERAEPIRAIHVREGDRVAAGALLVELDDSRARAERAQLVAQRDRVAAQLAEIARGPRSEAILEASARLAAADAALDEAERQRARVAELELADLASERERDAAESAYDQASGARDAARAALAALRTGATDEELLQARAALAEADAALATQAIALERLMLRAPRAARVEALPFEVGETPPAGAALVRLHALDEPPYARVYVPAALHAQLQPGARVRVDVDGHGAYAGVVRYLSAEAAYTPYFALTEHDAGRLTYLAEIDLEGAEALPSGVPVRALIPAR